MAKDITMWWDGAQRNYNGVKKIQAPDIEGHDKLWLPEDETTRGGLTVYQNGEYTAAANNLYGFSSVIVNVSQATSVTGHGQDGNDYTVTVDPTTGEIVETVAPSKIGIIQFPTKMLYTEGETIDYSGIVVQAYDAHDNIWSDDTHPNGIIPFNELYFPTTTAHADGGGGSSEEYTDGNGLNCIKLKLSNPYAFSQYNVYYGAIIGYVDGSVLFGQNEPLSVYIRDIPDVEMYVTQYGGYLYYSLVTSGNSYTSGYFLPDLEGTHGRSRTINASGTMQKINYTTTGVVLTCPTSTINPENVSTANLHPSGGNTQDLPVQWHRPSDYALIENEFTISVSPAT